MARAKKKQEEKDQSIDELRAAAAALDREIFQLRNELSMQKKLEKPHLLKVKRKEKARVLTTITLKQKGVA
ncbi:MAG: 50S ribosomal protein L29 [Chlamydiae bacterium RIFCSPHIGHO2_12_FULL_49_9]|nr:MAG: 50S ribosomal protein L29 [Chlamydiae bacterium RIFCSPHIGHO2_12_FULL_49_9]